MLKKKPVKKSDKTSVTFEIEGFEKVPLRVVQLLCLLHDEGDDREEVRAVLVLLDQSIERVGEQVVFCDGGSH